MEIPDNLFSYYAVVFAFTVIITLLLFYNTMLKSANSNTQKIAPYVLVFSIVWIILQSVLSLNGVFYSNTNLLPPRIVLLGILPMLLLFIILFNTKNGKQFIDSLPLFHITLINCVRIPVEIVLYWLFIHQLVPQIMTFEGLNFDILAGISAPIIAYLGFISLKLNRNLFLIWNIISLVLLLNIVILAILSVPSPFQQISFDQPNIAILYFPFSLLPTFVVPVVIFGHLASIRQLIKK
jgi:hypothetical protein